MVVGLDQAPQRGLALVPDRGPRSAVHRLGLEPALGAGHLNPAVDGRAADRETPGNRAPRLSTIQHRRDHPAAQIA
jgi:hypothetical protein